VVVAVVAAAVAAAVQYFSNLLRLLESLLKELHLYKHND